VIEGENSRKDPGPGTPLLHRGISICFEVGAGGLWGLVNFSHRN